MEDDGPIFEAPGIFYETVSLAHLEVRDGLTPEVTNIRKHPNNIFPTILRATKDDKPSFKRPGIFCEAVGLVHLEVRGWSSPGGPTLKKTWKQVSLHYFTGQRA
jgi:hypothetical protein